MRTRLVVFGALLAAGVLAAGAQAATIAVPETTGSLSFEATVTGRDAEACALVAVEGRSAVLTQAQASLSAGVPVTVPLHLPPGTADGTYDVKATAYTAADCTGSSTSRVSDEIVYDTTPPQSFVWDMPADLCPSSETDRSCYVRRAAPFELDWDSARDALGAVTYQVRLAGRDVGAPTTRSETTIDLAALAGEGDLGVLEVVARDQMGLETAVTPARRLIVDRRAPTGRWLTPTGAWLRGRVPLRVRVADPAFSAGLRSIVLYSTPPSVGRGKELGRLSVEGQKRVFTDTSRLRDGRYELTALVADIAGNTSEIRKVYRVDNTPPRVSFGAPTELTLTARRPYRAGFVVRDAASPWLVRRATITRGGRIVARIPARRVRDRGVMRFAVPALAAGRYAMTVRVADLAGNEVRRDITLHVR